MTRAMNDELSLVEAIEGLLPFVTGPVLAATMCPGILLCLPGIALFVVPLLIPVVVLGALAALVGAVAAVPWLLARGAVRLLRSSA